ncbi:MAG: hypothetical protein M3454_05165, partial [Actinomycetota bacterium]|nr:hypothetical protein [Actinomycetota bacterium]
MLIVRSDGRRLLLWVEAKYTERFSAKRHRKPGYGRVTGRDGLGFKSGAADIAEAAATNQLWRNLMLAQESVSHDIDEAAVVVLTAANDAHATRAVAGTTALLREPEKHLTHVLLEDLIRVARTQT